MIQFIVITLQTRMKTTILSLYIALYTRHPWEIPTWLTLLLFFTPLVFGIAYLIYLNRNNHYWNKGLFPPNLRFNNDNLMEAYICLAARMIQIDSRERSEKTLYLKNYFQRHFPNESYDFGDSLKWSYNNPIKSVSVARWIRKNIPEKERRIQVMYFLTGIAMIDGQLVRQEYTILKSISPILGLSEAELEKIISMYRMREEKSHANKQQGKRKNTQELLEAAFKILGVTSSASLVEIKKAFRAQAKIHHPDKFMNESEEQQRIAHERFQLIRDAYEVLEKRLV